MLLLNNDKRTIHLNISNTMDIVPILHQEIDSLTPDLQEKVMLYIEQLKVQHGVEAFKEGLHQSKEEVIDNLKEAVEEMKLIKEGKGKSRPAKEFLDEL